jgi:DNA-binding NtrC family response regulator
MIWVSDARTSIARVRSEHFDLVILISTGEEMDLMETFFNLRDIRGSLPVIVVPQPGDAENVIARGFPMLRDSGLKSVQGVDGLISLLSAGKARTTTALDEAVRSHGRDNL